MLTAPRERFHVLKDIISLLKQIKGLGKAIIKHDYIDLFLFSVDYFIVGQISIYGV